MKLSSNNQSHITAVVFGLVFLMLLFIIPKWAFASVDIFAGLGGTEPVGTGTVLDTSENLAARAAIGQCEMLSAATPVCSTPLECAAMQLAALKAEMLCISDAQKNNADLQNNSQWKEYAKRVADEAKKEARKNAIASAFKSSLSLMAKQLAVDSATWIASGGKGQQPLFITEGFGAYLQNIGDSALGDFIDQIGQRYGVDLCKSPNLSLSIQTSINWKKPRQVRCTFSKMMTNWESAVQDANFSFEYNNSLNPGENDLSVFLKLSGESLVYVNDKVSVGQLDIVSTQGWKDVKDWANRILTPGTVVKEWLTGKVFNTSSVADEVFTGTVSDFVNSFVQTLVGQLLNNFKSGLFSGGSLNSNSSNNLLSGLALPDISSLLDSEAQPYSEGVAGAEARFNKLKQSEYAIGGPYQILSKLSSCPENSKDNPGPTDCVIDQSFSSYIKDKKQVWQVSEDFKNRLFAPNNSNSQNYTTAITYRTILILRKYRIVPIGWEIAANYLKDSRENITLGEIMDQFDQPGSKFYGLVDPYWVLKAPEVYCRRQGYGDHNTFQNSQDGTVSRDEDCVDEQQCIKENENGSCAAYGYCTEERRFWNFGTTCDSMNNTCQTFSSRQGGAVSYLSNSLDYRDCNSQNAGCRWYSNVYDSISKIWRNLAPEQVTQICKNAEGCSVDATGITIEQYHQISNLNTGNIAKMAASCSATSCTGLNHCVYNTVTKTCSVSGGCTIPYGASSCRLENCLEPNNALSNLNADFEDVADNSFLPQFWLEELSSGDNYTRDYRAAGKGQNNSAGLVVAANNAPQVADINSEILILKDIPLESTTSTYQFKFFARADYFTDGEIDIQIYKGKELAISIPLSSISTGWDDYIVSFDAGGYATATIKIVTQAGTTAQAYFDNFELKRLKGDCQENSVWISMPAISAVSSDMYFNRNVQTCDGSNDGCSQFIRTKAGLGGNLIYNGGFEFGLDGGWHALGTNGNIATTASFNHSGTHSLALKSSDGNDFVAILEEANHGVSLEKGKKYILSGWIYRPLGTVSSPVGIDLYQGSNSLISLKSNVNITGSWQRVSASFTVGQGIFTGSDYNFDLRLRTSYSVGNVYFDDIQIEEVPYNIDAPSSYSEYNPSYRPASQLAFLKKAPDYYNCYKSTTTGVWADSTNIFTILQNRNSLCSDYAPVCTADEVGCELYTPLNGDPAVPGVAETLDVCPGECVGYQVYKQEETNFASSRYTQFIADKTPKYCSARLAGCDEFTNLDDLAKGAEKREYYVSLQVCEKPGANDGTYYTWEGDDTAGYQLKVYKLKKSNIGNGSKPCTDLIYSTSTGSIGQALCVDHAEENLDKGYCNKDDMVANPDCREFYDANGNISHRLLSETITISSNCHPYRRTITQATNIEAGQDCISHEGFWNGSNECIYMAIPGEGLTCSASAKGCRAYTGNTGNNIRNILNSNFDVSTDTAGWILEQNGVTTTASTSNVATFVGGHSLTNSGIVAQSKTLKHQVSIASNKTYILSFWAKAGVDFVMDSIKFDSATSSSDFFSVTKVSNSNLSQSRTQITTEWREYELGPVFVNWEVDSSAENYLQFNLPSGARVYLNNIILKEVRNSVYLLENSWYTPFSCDNNLGDANGQNMYGNNPSDCADTTQGVDNHRCVPGNMLGCSAYRDRSGSLAYLKSFARLCRLEAAGCEKLIDTYNYDYPGGNIFNASSGISSIVVPKYSTAYLVTDEEYACPKSEKGCTAYGLPAINKYDEVTNYTTTYLKNLPDRYETDICKSNELWCEEYAGQNSFSYFKNPHGKVCEYVKKAGSAGSWVQQGTEEPCSTTTNQTFGTGYERFISKIQPIGVVDNVTGQVRTTDYEGWVGACPAAQSGCSEYIDPLTNIYTNLLVSKNYVLPSAPGGKGYYFMDLDQNSLYSVSIKTSVASPDRVELGIHCPATTANGLNQDVVLSSPDSSMEQYYIDDSGVALLKAGLQSGLEASGRFYVSSTVTSVGLSDQLKTKVRCQVYPISGDTDSIKIVKSGVYYKLSSSVNSGNCNGKVNFRTGCVLFNDRSLVDYSVTSTENRFLKNLIFDAQTTYNSDLASSVPAAGTSPSSASNTANMVVSASADRTCSDWLTCNTYQKSKNDSQFNFTENDKCLGISSCKAFDENGECGRLENSVSATSTYITEVDKNKTGYVMVNPKVATFTSGVLKGIINNPYDAMAQLGGTSEVVNGDFEMVFGSSSDPIGWVPGTLACKVSASIGGKKCELVKPKISSLNWNSGLFKVVYDPKRAESGSSYLQLNSGNIAISENIGVESGKGPYFLSFWVNTTNLVGSGDGSSASLPYAEVRFLFLNEKGQGINGDGTLRDLDGGINYNNGPDWRESDSLKIIQGVTWKHIVYEIIPPNGATDMRIALFNLAPDATNGFDNSKLGGYTMWDNIGVNTVLDTDGSSNGQLARTCRIYPASDAPGCRYNKDNTQYYGQYGYCLLRDPAINSQQCLQWWPVDNIAGESVNDYSAFYQERMPLYYCISKAQEKISFINVTLNVNASNLGDYESAMQLFESRTGTEVKFFPFSNVPKSMRTLLRYPYIYRFLYIGGYIGTNGENLWPLPLVSFMKPYEAFGFAGFLPFYYPTYNLPGGSAPGSKSIVVDSNDIADTNLSKSGEGKSLGDIVGDIGEWFTGIFNKISSFIVNAFSLIQDDYWGGWAMVGFNIQDIPVAFPLPWHTANYFKSGSGVVAGLLQFINDETIALGYTTFKIVSDEDGNYSGQATDPHPDVRGDILGYAISQGGSATTDDAYGSAVVGGVISNGFNVEYCDQIVKVVDSSGQQKAYSARTSPGASYKTSYTKDWDCVANGLYGDKFEKSPDVFSLSDGCESDSMDASDCSAPTTYVNTVNRCFDHSAYCLRINKELGANNDVPYNYCGNYYGKPDDKLYCCGGEIEDTNVGHYFGNVCNSQFEVVNPDYFCVDGKFIFANVYHLAGYGYNTDKRPFASLISPSTGQYPSEWDSKDDVAYNQPLFYEGNMDATGIGQARMGQVHDKNELQKLFAKSYGVWKWQDDSEGEDETYGRYVQTSGYDWSVPTVNCGGIGKREVYESSTPNGQCYNYPEITAAKTTNSEDSHGIKPNSPLKLEFNVNVDSEQLPIRSYSVAWGDNTTTTFSGTALLGRPASSDPFVLYHYYGDRAVTGLITISVKDNWNKEGWSVFSTTSSDPLNYNLRLDHREQQ